MKDACVLLIILGFCGCWVQSQFLNNRPFPTYSLENMPNTEFSCRDKILGGYYADPETQCQMFHVCVKVAGIGVQDFRFLCPNGTAFDQDHQICADWEDVDCDATTLYYSSDNFDLYRIGSGFESKAVKYGEDEETFALQRAETGDHRLNREHQSASVNQRKDNLNRYNNKQRNNNNNNNNNEKDIFKASSSSNFFNNRNNGKERDEDYDDNVNVNQDRDIEQRRKVVRNKVNRRPVNNNRNNQNENNNSRNENYNNRNQNRNNNNNRNNESESNKNRNNEFESNRNRNNEFESNRNRNNEFESNRNKNNEYESKRVRNNEFESAKNRNNEFESTKRPVTSFSNNFAGSSYIPSTTKQPTTIQNKQRTNKEYSQPSYTISTPAPFKQTQQYNSPPNRPTTTENYPQQQKQTVNYNNQYEVTKQKTTTYEKTENYPSNNPQYKKPTTPLKQYDINTPTTTLSPKPFSNYPTIPTTFAPRTNVAYTQLTQQTIASLNKNGQNNRQSTPKTTQFTQYTPTVPKITSTTPITRSSRFDETQYDDGSYNPKYDYDADKREDEFLKTAHSQNIAASRNELARTTKNQQQQQTTTVRATPKAFSVTTQRVVTTQKQKVTSSSLNLNPKKTKDASYDYAYYDTNAGSEPDYDVDTEIKKSTVKN